MIKVPFFSREELEALLYACEDAGEMYALAASSDEGDSDVGPIGDVLLSLVPRFQQVLEMWPTEVPASSIPTPAPHKVEPLDPNDPSERAVCAVCNELASEQKGKLVTRVGLNPHGDFFHINCLLEAHGL